MRKIRFMVLALFVLIGGYVSTFGQEAPKVCISQEAANKCADNVNVIVQQKAEIDAMQTALRNRDAIIEELKVKVAVESQKAVDAQAENLRLTAVLEALLKAYTKPKKWGIIVF